MRKVGSQYSQSYLGSITSDSGKSGFMDLWFNHKSAALKASHNISMSKIPQPKVVWWRGLFLRDLIVTGCAVVIGAGEASSTVVFFIVNGIGGMVAFRGGVGATGTTADSATGAFIVNGIGGMVEFGGSVGATDSVSGLLILILSLRGDI